MFRHVAKFCKQIPNADNNDIEFSVCACVSKFNMAEKSSEKFRSMNVASLKCYLQERGITVNGYLKPALVEIASAVEKMMLPVDPYFQRDNSVKNVQNRLIIHDIQIEDPFTMKTKNDFINCPPFGLYDIFNHLIYHSSEYDKQGLAAFKSYEDYRLYEDGYVRSLETILVQEAGIHVCVGKVQPTMRAKTDDGKDFYDLWFILEGRGPNRGSVIEAYCKCKGGRDGGCKHIASAMYSLEALLNSRGEESVTSGTCQWKPKTQSNSEPCEIKDVLIEKIKPPSNKRKKKSYTWLQNIEFDPRSSQDKKPRKKRSMSRFTKRLCPPDPPKEDFDGTPVILPLLKKLHLSCETKQDAGSMLQEVQVTNTKTSNNQGIMQEKISEYLKNNKEGTPEHFKESLVFTESEIEEVDKNTTAQWKCKQWHLHKVGFISASKCKEVFTRQTTLEKTSDTTPTRLAKSITTYNYSDNISKESVIEPNNPRDWGLKHENSARESYLRVQNHLHHKVKLTSRGFVISKSKPFIGASVDDVRSCECVQNCDRVIVEYKCPWLHKELSPKEAFLTKEIGGQQIGNKLQLKRDAKYFYQIQMQMFVLGLKLCEFVVWTKKGITTIQVPHDSTFTKTVCAKLEKFWISQVVPLMLLTAVHIPNQGM